jgi:lipoate-protein ligase B
VRFIEQDLTEYCLSLIDMEIAAECVHNGADEVVFITEHPEIYTAGKSFDPSDFRKKSNKGRIYYPNRGGRVTVHAPGQIVVYPIINLRERELGVTEYVRELEDWIIRILARFGVRSLKSEDGIGIWAESGKLGFVGVRISKGVSSHGFCVNINNDLSPFRNIIPCGLVDAKTTSLAKILGHQISSRDVAQTVIETCRF